jgi:hypothetical protein
MTGKRHARHVVRVLIAALPFGGIAAILSSLIMVTENGQFEAIDELGRPEYGHILMSALVTFVAAYVAALVVLTVIYPVVLLAHRALRARS